MTPISSDEGPKGHMLNGSAVQHTNRTKCNGESLSLTFSILGCDVSD